MKLNIVKTPGSWILVKLAERLYKTCQEIGLDISMMESPSQNVDVNLYFDMQNCYFGKSKVLDIGFFTHLDTGQSVNPRYLTIDHIVHQTKRYYDKFKEVYPENKMSVCNIGNINPGFELKKPVIGIFQRGQFVGKGYNFLLDNCNSNIFTFFKFIFVGKNWDNVVHKMRLNNIDVEYYTDENYDKYPELYSKIDYLLIPSLWEGGPMSIIEAYAMGIPIIAADVGIVKYHIDVDYMFEPGNFKELQKIMLSIVNEMKKRRNKLKHISNENTMNHFIGIAEKLYNEKK